MTEIRWACPASECRWTWTSSWPGEPAHWAWQEVGAVANDHLQSQHPGLARITEVCPHCLNSRWWSCPDRSVMSAPAGHTVRRAGGVEYDICPAIVRRTAVAATP